MQVLNKADGEKINQIVDYILNNYCKSVGEIKKRFDLTDEEYDMISDLMMPVMRYFNENKQLKININALLEAYQNEELRKRRERTRRGYFETKTPNS